MTLSQFARLGDILKQLHEVVLLADHADLLVVLVVEVAEAEGGLHLVLDRLLGGGSLHEFRCIFIASALLGLCWALVSERAINLCLRRFAYFANFVEGHEIIVFVIHFLIVFGLSAYFLIFSITVYGFISAILSHQIWLI